MDHLRPTYDDPLFAAAAQRPRTPPAAVPQGAGTAVAAATLQRPENLPVGQSQGFKGAENVPPCSPAFPLPPEFAAIWNVLEQHVGAEDAITAPAIAAAACLWPDMTPVNAGTKVRKILELTQDAWPFPICGDANGYYLAANAEELSHYCANLRSRAFCCHRRFASVRNAGRRAGFEYLGHGRWADSSPSAASGAPRSDTTRKEAPISSM